MDKKMTILKIAGWIIARWKKITMFMQIIMKIMETRITRGIMIIMR